MSAIAAVCFDLDGTLCVSAQSDAAFTRAVFERVGVDPLFTPRQMRAVTPAAVERERERHPDPGDETDDITDFYTNLVRAVVRDVDAGVDSIWVPTARPHESNPDDPDPAPAHRVDSLVEVCSLVCPSRRRKKQAGTAAVVSRRRPTARRARRRSPGGRGTARSTRGGPARPAR